MDKKTKQASGQDKIHLLAEGNHLPAARVVVSDDLLQQSDLICQDRDAEETIVQCIQLPVDLVVVDVLCEHLLLFVFVRLCCTDNGSQLLVHDHNVVLTPGDVTVVHQALSYGILSVNRLQGLLDKLNFLSGC
ncbi:hypothetical protein GDO81_020572 [Engystomops pustulosus]|uniref:Uncharacterized protein n=1 Tax=Engystomops pustulosus TaxID=76066 RepID=A0AAV6YQI4_ENGPU|nr:hypothetical protein GDO81_020572 [Engystomops pustulosus]